MRKLVILIGIVCVLGIGNITLAAEPVTDTGGPITDTGGSGLTTIPSIPLEDPLAGTTLEGLLKRIITWLITIAAPVAAGMVVYGAYQMLFAAGEPEKIKKGKTTILYTVIGYGIIFIGWGLVSVIENFLKGA